jgi:hypothetical protein
MTWFYETFLYYCTLLGVAAFILFTTTYFLRRYLFYYVVRTFFGVLYWKIRVGLFFDRFRKKKSTSELNAEILNEVRLDESKTLYEVACWKGQKCYTLSFLAKSKADVHKAITELLGDVDSVIEKRSLIVYCGLSTTSGEFICDLTEVFRRFVFYFEHDEACPLRADTKLDHFLAYIKRTHPSLNEWDTVFEVHKNDLHFTETRFTLVELYGKSFADVLV